MPPLTCRPKATSTAVTVVASGGASSDCDCVGTGMYGEETTQIRSSDVQNMMLAKVEAERLVMNAK